MTVISRPVDLCGGGFKCLTVSKPMTRYAVMAEAVQDPYHDLTLIGPTVEADGPEEAAREVLDRSPHDADSIVDEELMVFQISDTPASEVRVGDL